MDVREDWEKMELGVREEVSKVSINLEFFEGLEDGVGDNMVC